MFVTTLAAIQTGFQRIINRNKFLLSLNETTAFEPLPRAHQMEDH